MNYRKGMTIVLVTAGLGLAGCETPRQYPTAGYPEVAPAYVSGYGYVESIEAVPGGRGASGLGALGGAVAGGALGRDIGDGSTAATIGGAVIGGAVGHQVEKHVRGTQDTDYRIRVRMDDGTFRTFVQDTHAGLRVGERVRVEDGRVFRM